MEKIKSMKKVMTELSKNRKDHPALEIYSTRPENLLIIDQEHESVIIISAKRRIQTFPLPQ
jgi:hypothetical protein